MANDPVIKPDSGGGPSAPAAGSVVPASISTSPTDTFVFPDNLDVQGAGNGGVQGATFFLRGQGTGKQDFSMENFNGNLYFRNESTNQFLMHLDSGSGRLIMNAYALDLGNNPIYSVQSIGVGLTTPGASAAVQIDSTTQGFLPPRMSSSQKNGISSPAEGLVVYDTDLHALCFYNGSAWKTVTAS